MANSAQANKRIRQNKTSNTRNRMRKSRVRTAVKGLQDLIHKGDKDGALKKSSEVQKLIDQATSAGIYKKNAAARLKSKLMREINSIS